MLVLCWGTLRVTPVWVSERERRERGIDGEERPDKDRKVGWKGLRRQNFSTSKGANLVGEVGEGVDMLSLVRQGHCHYIAEFLLLSSRHTHNPEQQGDKV